jgi:hypothetical protein
MRRQAAQSEIDHPIPAASQRNIGANSPKSIGKRGTNLKKPNVFREIADFIDLEKPLKVRRSGARLR